MKRLVSFLLLFILVLSMCCASAEITDQTIADFSIYCAVFGLPDLYIKDAVVKKINNGKIHIAAESIINNNKCILTFNNSEQINGIFVDGNGDEFLAFCLGYFAAVDKQGLTADAGQLLMGYLTADDMKYYGTDSDGNVFIIDKEDNIIHFSTIKE